MGRKAEKRESESIGKDYQVSWGHEKEAACSPLYDDKFELQIGK